MENATKITIAIFGAVNTIAAFEHGLGEILQGNRTPESIIFYSWPDSPFFQILNGEPAMSLIPNLLVSGILTMLVSLVFLAWVTRLNDRKHAGLVLILLSFLLLGIGGGFGPPLFGTIMGITLSLNGNRRTTQAKNLAVWRRFLGRQWSRLFIAAMVAWLLVFPGLSFLDFTFHLPLSEGLIYTTIFSAFVLMPLALWAASARDRSHPDRL